MPTNVVYGGAAGYDSGGEDLGIGSGMQRLLGMYMHYNQQKRFEEQQKEDHRLKAMAMAERAEQNEAIRANLADAQNARKAAAAQQRALLTPADTDPSQLPPEWVQEQTIQAPKMATDIGIKDASGEVGGPLASQIQVGTQEKTVKKPKAYVEYGDYVAPLDIGGVAAQKRAHDAKTADYITLRQDFMGYKAGEKVPPAVWALAEKQAGEKPQFQHGPGGAIYAVGPNGELELKVAGKEPAEAGSKSTKLVYDTVKKKDVWVTEAQLAADQERYGAPQKSGGEGKPILAGELSRITELRQGLQAIKGLRGEISAQDSTGLLARFAAWVPGVTNLTGWGADAKSRQATIKLVKQIIGKGLEGGVLRKEDEAKYADILPAMGDLTEVAADKVNKLEQRLRDNEQIMMENLEAGGRNVEALKKVGIKAGPGASAPKDPLGLGL